MSSKIVLPQKIDSVLMPVECDFISQMDIGEGLVGCSVTCSVLSGVDASPEDLLSGSATISGTTATQRVTGGLPGVIYQLNFAGTTSFGNEIIIVGALAVVNDTPFESV